MTDVQYKIKLTNLNYLASVNLDDFPGILTLVLY